MTQGGVCGIVTDRDIAIRAVAEGKDPESTPVTEICSRSLTTLAPDHSVADAVERDPESALADISAAPANE